jgi:hypothetical protein
MSKIIHFTGAKRPVSAQADIRVDRGTSPQPYEPDPRNGEVWVPEVEGVRCQYVNGEWVETPCGFSVIHMSSGGGSAGGEDGFAPLEEAKAAAVRIARERNAVLR